MNQTFQEQRSNVNFPPVQSSWCSGVTTPRVMQGAGSAGGSMGMGLCQSASHQSPFECHGGFFLVVLGHARTWSGVED
jgi:hypothetical protein